MEDHAALVTAGAQGIGLACSRALIEAGMQVLMVDSDARAGREAVAQLGERAHFLKGDVADARLIAAAVKRADKLGRGLHSVVSNAGVMIRKPVEQLSLAEWNRALSVNLTPAFLLARHAAPLLQKSREGGAMVLVASSRALQSEPHTESYSASKGGLVALAHALSISLGPKVRVNSVSPGWIDTSQWQRADRPQRPKLSRADHAQHPVGRVGKPEDVAALVRFLLSSEAGFISGGHYLVDGGMTRKMIYV
jgi:NAD(P)-dependent dehydrogenase (short-subunit alcohol dehydrogenase family)